ncbi:hypothetical protein BH09PSE3_BH09PSE3_18030 [soil metagenome]
MVRLQIARTEEPVRSGAADVIKQVALRLFADRGVDGVTVREIAAAAQQKNHGAVGYYFGSKEALVRALVMDGALALDHHRNSELDRLEALGGPHTIRQIVDILIFPVISLNDEYYVQFIVILAMTHRDLMMDAIDASWNRAYGRCLTHLRRLMPDLPVSLQNQRFVFMGAYLSSVLSARQRALADRSRNHHMWEAEHCLEHFAQSLVALLEAPLDIPPESMGQNHVSMPEAHGPVG